MIARRSKGGLYIEPGCPARPATARLRRACGGAHSRPAAEPTDTALNPLAPLRQGFSQQMSIDSFMVRNLTQNRRNIFHLNCVPRHISPPACSSNSLFNTNKGIFHPSLPDSLIDRNLFSTMSCSISRMKFKVIKTGRPILSEDVCHFLVLAV